MYGPTMQCNSKTYYQMFQLSATVPNLCPQFESSLIDLLINDCLLHAWQTTIRTQLINISHRILTGSILQHCRDSVIYVLKFWMLRSHRLGAIIEVRRLVTKLHDVCVYTVRWPAVLLKLRLVRRLWLYKECGIHGWYEIYWRICLPKIVIIDDVLTELLQK